MKRDISREEQRECVKKDSVEGDKASYINIFRESTTLDELGTCGKPSMAPKRKESFPKSACCISDTRVFLHEHDQCGIRASTDEVAGRT